MLLNDFFTMPAVDGEGMDASVGGARTYNAKLMLNAGHRIFSGHFPGQPVVPGACLLQMVREVTEQILGKELRLRKADQCKFIKLIDPGDNNELEMKIVMQVKEEGLVSVTASLLNKGAVSFKFGGLFGNYADS